MARRWKRTITVSVIDRKWKRAALAKYETKANPRKIAAGTNYSGFSTLAGSSKS